MAIVKMNKFTLLSFEEKKASLLEKLQNFSEIEFINLQDEKVLEENEILSDLTKDSIDSEFAKSEENLSKVKFALEFLKSYVPPKSSIKAMKEGKKTLSASELEANVEKSDWEALYEKLKEKELHLSNLDNEKTRLEGENETLKPWEGLDCPFSEIRSLKVPYFLGSVSNQYKEELVSSLGDSYVEIISCDNQDMYLLVITGDEKKEEVEEALRGFGFSSFKTEEADSPIKVIHTNMDRIEKINAEKFFIKEELQALEKEVETLEQVYDYYHNTNSRNVVATNFLKTDTMSIIQGWVAVSDNNDLEKVIKDSIGEDYYLTFEDVKEEEIDIVPIRLQNNAVNKSFETITEMYSMPRYDDIDPTPFLAPFFLLFFGMMVADVGYGLLLCIGSFIALKVFNLDNKQEQFAKFFFYLSFPTMVFGLIYGSFFGDLIPLPKLIDTNKDVNTILIMSIVFGVIQIFVGLAIKAYVLIRDGRAKDAFYDVGSWVITLVSIGLLIAGFGFAKYTMIIGMILIVLTQGREAESVGAKLGGGLYALYGITGYIGDLVSYTRLMALGLAGGSIAGALNLIIGMLPGVALIVLGPVLFILFHIFNLGLSLLGAYVHTCRLEYVEYFSKFYEGGGKPFVPFKTLDKFINIKKEI